MRSYSRNPRAASSVAPLIPIAQHGVPFTSGSGQAFVRLRVSTEGFVILAVRSQAYRDWFFAQYYAAHDALPSSHAFRTILHHLEAQANNDSDNRRLSVFRRVGSRGQGFIPDQILLDLANSEGQFVEISPDGWRVTAGTNALLQTSLSARELPAPLHGPEDAPPDPAATLETLRACLNLSSRADWLRCLAWLLAALRPTGPFPILILQGPPGSGKTSAARLLRFLIDPSTAPFTPFPHNTRHLLSLARHNWVLAFDHIGKLSPQLGDALCRLSTGVGVLVPETPLPDPTRDPLLKHLSRPMIFTVTDKWSPAPDFAGRALAVTLPEIPNTNRRADTDLLTTYSDAYPHLLGALCSAVATALQRVSAVRFSEATRQAGAQAWAMAAAPALGCTEAEMQQAFTGPTAHPLVQSIEALLIPQGLWTGTAADLLPHLAPSTEYQTPKGLSQHLKTAAPRLASAGIQLAFSRSRRGDRIIELRRNPFDASSGIDPQDASKTTVADPQPTESKDLKAA